MTQRDYYEILGVSKNATPDEISRAHKKLAKKYHPDVCKDADAQEKFEEVQKAYECLSDKDKRANYDRFGSEEPQFEGFDPFGGFNPFGGFGFGSGRPRGVQKERGGDIKTTIRLSMEDMFYGVHKKIKIKKEVPCHHCSGSGSETNNTSTCPDCNGTGWKTVTQRRGNMMFQSNEPCPRCHGTGTIISDPCPKCGGRGTKFEEVEVEFDVPAGIPSGAYFTLRGQGNAGPHRGIPGDLHVIVMEIPNNDGLSRDDEYNLWYTLKLKYSELVEGCTKEIPYVRGTKKINIPAASQPGKVVTLYGMGFEDPNSRRKGDYKVELSIDIPKLSQFNKEEKKHFEELKKSNIF